MESSLKAKIFVWSWRIALLALPWQTHLIVRDEMSVYASWFPILSAIVFGFWLHPPSDRSASTRRIIFWSTFIVLALGATASQAPLATFQWWMQVGLLFLFAWTLARAQIETREILSWIIIGLIPHALLALEQALTQNVFASKWLGIAAQLPETRGVAVVEANGVRLLRAYGGMPYPNILGGWLVFALPATVWLASFARDYRRWLWIGVTSLFSLALILTHSRSAWLALLVFLTSFIILYVFPSLSSRPRSSTTSGEIASNGIGFWLMVVPIAIAFLIGIIWQADALKTRVVVEGRLEERSISERLTGFDVGWQVFKAYPFFGIGPGAFRTMYANSALPHNVPLLASTETGVIGILGLIIFLMIFLIKIRNRKQFFILLFPFLVIAALDHYPWSYWPGQALVALLLLIISISDRENNEGSKD